MHLKKVYNNDMNLHRTTGKPDWDSIHTADRTSFQRVAARTNGIVTPANIITIFGFGIVLYGLWAILSQQFWIGLIALAIGRLLDVVDGWVANATGTKSPLGELLDAAVDKIGTLLTIVIFFIAQVTYWWVIILLVLPQVAIPLVSFYKRRKGIKIHPTRIGKFSMASAWVGLVGLLVVRALGLTWPDGLVVFVDLFVILSFILGIYALWQYSTGRD